MTEGCYLLRTNLPETDPAVLWKRYIQLTEAEWVFRITKDELEIRPIWHQKTDRVLAHILVCFLAYVLWKTWGSGCSLRKSSVAGWAKCNFLGPREAPRDQGYFFKRGILAGYGGNLGDFSGLPPESCEMWRILHGFRVSSGPGMRHYGAGSKGEEIMAEKETSGTLHNDRLTSQVSSAAPGGPSLAERAAAMAPHPWTLQFLIAVIKEADRKRPKSVPDLVRRVNNMSRYSSKTGRRPYTTTATMTHDVGKIGPWSARPDEDLLAEYAEKETRDAFEELVHRYERECMATSAST